MLNKNDGKRLKLAEDEEAWNVLTDEYDSEGIPKNSIVVSSTTIPKGWNMREPRLVLLIIEGVGDRGPTGAYFIRKMSMARDGKVHFEPNTFDPKFPVTFAGFVKETVTRKLLE